MTRARTARRGFTLVELLVSMAIIIALASLALLVVPAALDRDQTTDASTLTRQWLMIAKSRAARDGTPRGVRLIVDPSKPLANQLLVTELQYTELPTPFIPTSANSGVASANAVPPGDPSSPKAVLTYTLAGTNSTNPVPGTVLSRQCDLVNLTAAQWEQIYVGSYLDLGLGTQHLITNMPNNPPAGGTTVTLNYYPDAELGAAGVLLTTNAPKAVYVCYFGLAGPGGSSAGTAGGMSGGAIRYPPQPLLGEPTLQLPRDIVIDLSVSSPNGSAAVNGNYDIVFAPNGQVIPTIGAGTSTGQINLWVRNSRKKVTLSNNGAIPPTIATADSTTGAGVPFDNGGEQQLVSIKPKSGALGVFKVRWPDNTVTGQYANGFDPFYFTRRGADEAQ